MSQRNPMNERYQSEQPKGQTRKSAASLKPKNKAASSVRVASTTKTPKEQRENRKAQRARDRERANLYYNPPTPEYKRLRTAWIVCIVGALLLTIIGGFASVKLQSGNLSWAFIIPAYLLIFVAIYLDLGKIRKVRQAYQKEMERIHGKNADEAAKAAIAAQEKLKEAKRAAKNAKKEAKKADKETDKE